MAVYLPPDLIFLPPPPPPPWRPPPSPMPTPTHNSSTSPEGVIAGVSIVVVGIVLFMLCCVCRLAQGHNQSRASAGSDAAAAAAAVAARPQAPPVPEPLDNDERQLRSAREREDGRPQRAIPAAGLPLFTYNRSVKHDVGTGSGEEEATCSVCLGAFQIGEMVRLLPVCLHLYHVECIDPWLDAHSTCPLCRSGTGPMMDGGQLPPA